MTEKGIEGKKMIYRATKLSRNLKIAENMYKLAPTQNWTDHHLQRSRIRVEESYESLLAQPGLNHDGQSPEIDGRSGLVYPKPCTVPIEQIAGSTDSLQG